MAFQLVQLLSLPPAGLARRPTQAPDLVLLVRRGSGLQCRELLVRKLPTRCHTFAKIIQQHIDGGHGERGSWQGREHRGRRNHRVAFNGLDKLCELSRAQSGQSRNFRRLKPAQRVIGAPELAEQEREGVGLEDGLSRRQPAQGLKSEGNKFANVSHEVATAEK